MSSCDECGFDGEVSRDAAIALLRLLGSRFHTTVAAVARPEAVGLLCARPEPTVWSPLEYTAHTRDTMAWYADRIERVLAEHRPQLGAFDWDAACEERRYADEELDVVVGGLRTEAERLADRLHDLEDGGWGRVGVGSNGEERTVLVLARRAVHEGVHHLHDIERILAANRSHQA